MTSNSKTTIDMPPVPNKEDLEALWTYLEAGLHRVMYNSRESIDMKTYMNIYTAVHNFCTSQTMDKTMQGEGLYKNLTEYLTNYLGKLHKKSKSHVDEALISFYAREWRQYSTAAISVNELFKYLNRHWLKRKIDSGAVGFYDVHTLFHVLWREKLLPEIISELMAGVLNLIERNRNGEVIEHSQIKLVLKSITDLYHPHFEKPFVYATMPYYKIKSVAFLAANSVVAYIKKATTWVNEEKMRVELCLRPKTMKPLMISCVNVLVGEHTDLLLDEFQVMLEGDRQDDLALMYHFFVPFRTWYGDKDIFAPLHTMFEDYVRKSGLEAIENLAAEEKKIEPKTYIDTLFEIHARYRKLLDKAFPEDTEFVRSFDNACKEFVNRNKVCGESSTQSAELLAKYTDAFLKKDTEEDNLEDSLSRAMTIFKYIDDKDMFQTIYSRMLAKRLVNSSSSSDDAESSMISKLKEACGFAYTNKLQRMIQDIKICKDLNSAYKDSQNKTRDEHDATKEVDGSYSVLNTGIWPLPQPQTTFIPPPELTKACTDFQEFYLDKHNGRKLTWLWNLCRGELRANYLKTKVPYTFMVSIYQMGILLLFNDAEVVTYKDAQKTTTLAAEWLDPSLGALLKAKVLNSSPQSGKTGPGTSYTLNHGFKSKRVKVNLNITVKADQKKDTEDAQATVDEYRKVFLQSTIVRIMKARQKMKYVELVQEILAQVSSRFTPKIPDIKFTIDQLVDKEYLERLENQELQYLA